MGPIDIFIVIPIYAEHGSSMSNTQSLEFLPFKANAAATADFVIRWKVTVLVCLICQASVRQMSISNMCLSWNWDLFDVYVLHCLWVMEFSHLLFHGWIGSKTQRSRIKWKPRRNVWVYRKYLASLQTVTWQICIIQEAESSL